MKERQIGIGHITAVARQRLQALGVDPACVLVDHAAGHWGVVSGSIVEYNRDTRGYGGYIGAHDLGAGEFVIVVTAVTVDARQRRTYVYLSTEETPDITGKGI